MAAALVDPWSARPPKQGSWHRGTAVQSLPVDDVTRQAQI